MASTTCRPARASGGGGGLVAATARRRRGRRRPTAARLESRRATATGDPPGPGTCSTCVTASGRARRAAGRAASGRSPTRSTVDAVTRVAPTYARTNRQAGGRGQRLRDAGGVDDVDSGERCGQEEDRWSCRWRPAPIGDHTVLEVGGEVDVYTAPRLRERLIELVDGGATAAWSSTWSGSTSSTPPASACWSARSSGSAPPTARFGLVCAKEPLLKIFRITALDQVFPLYATVEAATARGRDGAARPRDGDGPALVLAGAGARPHRPAGGRRGRPAGRGRRGAARRGPAGDRRGVHAGGRAAPPVRPARPRPGRDVRRRARYTVRVIDRAPIEAGLGHRRAAAGRAGRRGADRRGADGRRRIRPARRASSTISRCARSTRASAPRCGWSGRSPVRRYASATRDASTRTTQPV